MVVFLRVMKTVLSHNRRKTEIKMSSVKGTITQLVVSFVCFQATVSGINLSYGNDKSLDDAVCAVDEMAFVRQSQSLLMCVALCKDHVTCNSYFYKKGAETCYGCTAVYVDAAGMPSEVGTKYYKIECGSVLPILNGYFEQPTTTLQGQVVQYYCNSGYGFLDDQQTSTCSATGLWSEVPQCLIDCGSPPGLNKGEVVSSESSTHTLKGAIVKYKCSYSATSCIYNIVYGSSTATCQSNGVWSSPGSYQTLAESGFLPDEVTALDSSTVNGCQSTFGNTTCNSYVEDGLLFNGTFGRCYCDSVCCKMKDCCYDFNCYPSE